MEGGYVTVISLSRHFCERWRQRVGAKPTLEGVNRLIENSLQIRKQAKVLVDDCGRLKPLKLLAEFWNHEAGIIIKVDADRGCAVTVVTPRCVRRETGGKHA